MYFMRDWIGPEKIESISRKALKSIWDWTEGGTSDRQDNPRCGCGDNFHQNPARGYFSFQLDLGSATARAHHHRCTGGIWKEMLLDI